VFHPKAVDEGEAPLLQRIRRLICSEWFLLLAVTIVAAALRWYALDHLPPGLYHDEAYNGLDALGVIRGSRPIFFEANNGREPLFIYLVALSMSFLARSPLAVRMVAALLGTLTVPAAYLMARELLGRREALLTAAVTAITFWHLNLSRVGFRAVGLPLLTALCLWFVARGQHTRRRTDFALGGFCLGLSFYTYLAARFLPIAFGVWILYRLWRREPMNRRGWLLFFAVALIVASPLLVYAAQHLDTFSERSMQVSIFNPAINQGDFAGTLLRHVGKTLGMFNFRGDFIPRHNLPHRPVFDLALGLAFLLGLATVMRRASQRQQYALLLICWVVMLLPTIFAEDAPHFLRAVGILPVLFVFPAVGLKMVWDALRARTTLQMASFAIALLLGWSLYATVNDYFFQHTRSEAAYYNFEAGATEIASQVNHFVGTGWHQGSGLRVAEQTPLPHSRVYLDERLWRDWASLRYLVPDTPNFVLLGESAPPPTSQDTVWLITWPYTEYQQHLKLLPMGQLISAREGPLERGDLEEQARLLCIIHEAVPARHVPSNLMVQFERGIQLLGYEWLKKGAGLRLRLFWRAVEALDVDYSVFVHWRRGDQAVAQSDSYPAQGYYPTHLWRPGDFVADDHPLTASAAPGEGDSISVGLYSLQTMQRLQVLDATGAAIADHVTIPLPQAPLL
jgi:4-amino-4-deoxy-L-arabinose transferase-like glycosyltransferase